jgi:hypothetical protein
VLLRPNAYYFLFSFLTASTAAAQVCSGPTAWICEEHQLFNREPPGSKFDYNSLPKEMLGANPGPTEKPAPAYQDESTLAQGPCLSQKEIRAGWPKYRIINGRRCWYASTPPRKNAPSTNGQTTGNASSMPQGMSRLSTRECEEQALKLEGNEKRTFLQQCMLSAK